MEMLHTRTCVPSPQGYRDKLVKAAEVIIALRAPTEIILRVSYIILLPSRRLLCFPSKAMYLKVHRHKGSGEESKNISVLLL